MSRTSIADCLSQGRVLLLDGAMGTMIQTFRFGEQDFRGQQFAHLPGIQQGNNDLLSITQPQAIRQIHRRYLETGADIISTNTFNAQRISLADYGCQELVKDINRAAVANAKAEANAFNSAAQPRFVVASVGPTNKTLSMSPDVGDPAFRAVSYDEMQAAYVEQISTLLECGVDGILLETIFDTLNAKAAICAAHDVMQRRGAELPVMLSVTISDAAGRTLSGQTLDAFLASVSTYPVFSVGLNCSFGADQMKPYLRQLAAHAPYYISAYPNAGLPNSMGLYDETPDSMAPKIAELIDEGLVNIVGGCCGTTDEFIRRYVPLVEGRRPHQVAERPQTLWLSGLELLDVTPEVRFVNVGERCNVAGSRKFLRLIKEKQYDEALTIARKQVEDGALVIDINMDDGLLDARQEMTTFLNLLAAEPDIARVPLMIDSSKWDVITAALQCVQGKSIVNSISLKEGEEVFLSHARDVMRYGAAVVVMCFDEQGQATTFERRIEIARRAYRLLTEQVGMNPLDIIFDPNILAIATGMDEHNLYAADFIRATQWIRQNLPGAHVSGGVSNLSFSFRGNNYLREAMHAVFLYHAIQAGMDFGIVNPATKVTYADLPKEQLTAIEDAILRGNPEGLLELAEEPIDSIASIASIDSTASIASPPLEDRLQQALIRGIGDNLEADLQEALAKYPSPVAIIEGPLMAAMNIVGERFGQGKMFLPQVVKTARTMKQAVSILQPYLQGQQATDNVRAGKVLLATVKGDVHDIGKNIVAVVMACNNYEVIDMGVMVPAEDIVRKAKEEHVDMIGLSGLITPSLEEMVNVARELDRAGLHIPIMIGGATTSELHVALKIAPVYAGPVLWLKDASQNALVAQRLMTEEQQVEQELDAKYARMREDYNHEQEQLLSLDEARKNKLKLFEE